MNRALALLIALLIPAFTYAEPKDHIWESAAYGNIPGLTYVQLYGINGGIPATFEAVWPESADYSPQVAALSSPYCASTDANDTSAGTGARTVSISGIDTSFARFTETITMNGQTSVVIAKTNVLLIDSMEVLTAGSGGLNAGVVACGTGANTAGDPAVIHSIMPISSLTVVAGAGNKSMSFIYGVPDNYSLLCTNITAGSVFATAASSIQVIIEGFTNLGLQKRFFGQHGHNTGANPQISTSFVKFPEKTIIVGKMAGPTGSNVGPVSLRADCLLISDTWAATAQTVF